MNPIDSVKQGMSVESTSQLFKDAHGGPLSVDPRFAQELKEVEKYYQFFDGFDAMNMNMDYGQTWKTPDNMDYTPTKEIRNYAKKLIKKQARFMMGTPAELHVSAVQKGQEQQAEQKRLLLDEILQRASFWSKAQKALVDSTIGKRVLMVVTANPGENIGVKFYSMPQFSYVFDPDDSDKLLYIDIVYQDERTVGKSAGDQLWHHYRYEMRSTSGEIESTQQTPAQASETSESGAQATCWLTYSLTDGSNRQLYVKREDDTSETAALTTQLNEAKIATIRDNVGNEIEVPMIVKEETDTKFSQIPAYVIRNEALTGDVYGTSDIKDLMPLAENYNRTISDLRDALKFKMFEQPVIIDADSNSIKNLKIAPNALIDLKTDPRQSLAGGTSSKQASVTTLASSFNFTDPVKYYLDDTKKALYEMMDQPLPEKVQEAPSGKAMKFLFYDLMSRCDSKWIEWDNAIVWMIGFIEEAFEKVSDMYEDIDASLLGSMSIQTTESIKHIYPLPEDENEKKTTAMSEVTSNVRSHKSYIREFGMVENEESEWEDIIEELAQIDEISNGFENALQTTSEEEGEGEDGNEEGNEGNEEEDEEGGEGTGTPAS